MFPYGMIAAVVVPIRDPGAMPVLAYKTLRAAGTSGAYFRRSVLLRLSVFLALSLPVLWLGVGAELRQLDTTAQRESNRDVENMARAFSEEINATVSMIDLSLLHLRSHWERDPGEFAIMVERLNRELHGRVILHVTVTDARGVVVFSSLDRSKRVDLSDREHIRYHLGGNPDGLFVGRDRRFGRAHVLHALLQQHRPGGWHLDCAGAARWYGHCALRQRLAAQLCRRVAGRLPVPA
jgi:hypothetical protein